MGKPRLIILIRHAQSEGNKNRDIHQTVPDHRVKLTAEGWKQAEEAGHKLRALLRPTDTLHFFTSPYRRTRETTTGILSALTSPAPTTGAPSPFPLSTIKVYEEPRLREQDFGNFQPSSAAMAAMWQERAAYGHFFYRIPNGESAADAYDRVSGFNESLWRGFGEEGFASVCVLVTHGLMTRVFLMKWYHYSVEYFEDLRNVEHCEFVVMRLGTEGEEQGRYILENKLRTWSELKGEKRGNVPVRNRWGGCAEDFKRGVPGGREVRRRNTGEEFLEEQECKGGGASGKEEMQDEVPSDENTDDPRGRVGPPADAEISSEGESESHGNSGSSKDGKKPSGKERIYSPNRLEILKAGRDGGGSRSGAASLDVSDAEEASVEPKSKKKPRSMALALNGGLGVEPGMRSGVRADALGDQSDIDEDDEEEVARREAEELERLEKEDRSVEGSVY
ncbi:hypothetical protein MMC30_001994 [Trapelia coarctata]|nr:hypothetical protein [Trapelia coarctata]